MTKDEITIMVTVAKATKKIMGVMGKGDETSLPDAVIWMAQRIEALEAELSKTN